MSDSEILEPGDIPAPGFQGRKPAHWQIQRNAQQHSRKPHRTDAVEAEVVALVQAKQGNAGQIQ